MTPPRPQLGVDATGAPVYIDVPRLVETRLLLTATSGAGKSWALRRILEQTHGQIQQIVIDPEDEFHSLREKYDYVLAGRDGGDCPADTRSASLLATRLLELGVSTIIGIYELPHHDRIRFVRLFLEALVNAPKKLWHPALIVIDEAHIFSPEAGKGEAESKQAVADLMSRGRKRGFAGLLATQRYSKLDKDAASMCTNVMVGRFTLDVDVKRAVDALGFTGREDQARIRALKDGYFYCHGPALTPTVELVHVGAVVTTHPKAGQRAAAPVPPRATIQRVLGELADLPAEAERKQKTEADLRAEVQALTRQLAARPAVEVDPAALAAAEERGHATAVAHYKGEFMRIIESLAPVTAVLKTVQEQLLHIPNVIHPVWAGPVAPVATEVASFRRFMRQKGDTQHPTNLAIQEGAAIAERVELVQRNGNLSGPEHRILDGLAELEALGLPIPERAQVALMARYTNTNSKGFANAMGSLSTAGYVHYPSPGTIQLTDAGRPHATPRDIPTTSQELQDRLFGLLDGPQSRILRVLVAARHAVPRAELGERAGYTNTNSKGFANSMGRLRSLGLITYPAPGVIRASPILFLDK